MTEKTMGDYSIGHLRMKYLDLANMTFTQQQYILCEGYLTSFMETVDDNSESSKKIKEGFDRIELQRRLALNQLMDHVKDMGELEKTDTKNQGELEITVEGLHDKKTICWTVALSQGLFHE